MARKTKKQIEDTKRAFRNSQEYVDAERGREDSSQELLEELEMIRDRFQAETLQDWLGPPKARNEV